MYQLHKKSLVRKPTETGAWQAISMGLQNDPQGHIPHVPCLAHDVVQGCLSCWEGETQQSLCRAQRVEILAFCPLSSWLKVA